MEPNLNNHRHSEDDNEKYSSNLKIMKMKTTTEKKKMKKLENTNISNNNNKLRIKLKIKDQSNPKTQEQEKNQEEEIKGSSSSSSGGGGVDQIRVCPICQKGFNSGKALGGHMRVHSESSSAHPKSNLNPNPNQNSTPGVFGCVLCGKEFPSEKSLYGHMRSHPDRQWRGMQQPPSVGSGSDGSGSDRAEAVEDLPRWGVKGKRGRSQCGGGGGLEAVALAAAGDLIVLGRGEFQDPKRVCFDSDELYYLQNLTSDDHHHQENPRNEEMGDEIGKRVIGEKKTLVGKKNKSFFNNSNNAPSIQTHIHTHIHLPPVYEPRAAGVALKDETGSGNNSKNYVENEVVVNKDKIRSKSNVPREQPVERRGGTILDLDLNVVPPLVTEEEDEVDDKLV